LFKNKRDRDCGALGAKMEIKKQQIDGKLKEVIVQIDKIVKSDVVRCILFFGLFPFLRHLALL
jgi:hypothetical protein